MLTTKDIKKYFSEYFEVIYNRHNFIEIVGVTVTILLLIFYKISTVTVFDLFYTLHYLKHYPTWTHSAYFWRINETVYRKRIIKIIDKLFKLNEIK